jgi:hypothetical protein
VIVRISGEGQYHLADDDVSRVQELDRQAIAAVNASEHDRFHELFDEMIALVRDRGERLGDDELVGSDVILPPPDTTVAEAEAEFSGEGLIPG